MTDRCKYCKGILEEGEPDICYRCQRYIDDCPMCKRVLDWAKTAERPSVPIDLQRAFGEGVNHAKFIVLSMITGQKYDAYNMSFPEEF